MIDYMEIREIIEVFLADNFTESGVQYENRAAPETDDYVAVFDRQSFSESAGMGEDAIHSGGLLIFQIFTQLGIGTKRGREIADSLSTLFNSNDIGGLSFDVPNLQPAEPNEHYYQMNLVIPYTTVLAQIADSC